MENSERLSYLLFRCVQCRRLLTKYQIIERWESAERGESTINGVCTCGGSKISPANASIFEELTNPHIWKLWWKAVVLPWWRK